MIVNQHMGSAGPIAYGDFGILPLLIAAAPLLMDVMNTKPEELPPAPPLPKSNLPILLGVGALGVVGLGVTAWLVTR